MEELRFGAFLAPHHPIGEHPVLMIERDLQLAALLDDLGFDEFWCGEHHSTGWESIASPEMFLAGAAQRTHRIKLGTGVSSLPYHHPFMVAQRITQLDIMSRGRAMLGTGPGALPSDANAMGIDPMTQRDRQGEAISVIKPLLAGERVTHHADWFTLNDAALQLLPVQRELEITTASMVSPSGMTLAGTYGLGVLSIGSMSTAGIQSLPLQWSFAEDAAAISGATIDRRQWRVMFNFHIAETRDEARQQAKHGMQRWHNEYTVGTLLRHGAVAYDTPDQTVDELAFAEGSSAVVGTPDDLVDRITEMYEVTGGFGAVIGFANDWASVENQRRSWDLVARYVIPKVQGLSKPQLRSQRHVIENRESFDRAGKAVLSKILENDKAAAALKSANTTKTAIASPNAPDLDEAAAQ